MKRRGTKTKTATRKRKQRQHKRKRSIKIRRGGAPADPIGNVEASKIKKELEVAAFHKQIKEVANAQAGVPQLNEILELLRMFNQTTELIKHQKMRSEIIMKLDELEQHILDPLDKNKLQKISHNIREWIKRYEARI